MRTAYIFLKEAALRTNCPECYTKDGLLLSFYQKKIASKFYNRTTIEVEERLECKICETKIYPARWTDDIERMYEYHFKTVTPIKSEFSLTGLSIGLLVGLLLIAGAFVYYIAQFM